MALALLVAFLVIGPSQIGGPATYVVVAGTSMEPLLHKGDLAIVRKRETYVVGDAVLYESKSLRRSVLHRIAARDGQRLVMRGDNNDFDDGERPLTSQVRGELWFHVPKLGAFLAWFQQPLHAALFLGVLVLLALGGGSQASRRRAGRAPDSRPTPAAGPATDVAGRGYPFSPQTMLTAAAVIGVAALVLVVATIGKPQTRKIPVPRAYVHEGTFDWSAKTARSVVYPDGEVARGTPLFTRLVRRVDVRFAYELASGTRPRVSGRASLVARLSDDAGWERVVPITGPQSFAGRRVVVEGILDVQRLVGLVNRMKELTGSNVSLFSVTLEPRVVVAGAVGETRVEDVFAPTRRLLLDTVALRPEAPEVTEGSVDVTGAPVSADPGTTVTEEHEGTATVPARLELGPLSLPTRQARWLGLIGLVLAGLGAVWATLLRRRIGDQPESARLAARCGGRLVEAHVRIPDDRLVTDVADVDALVQLAEHYDRVILRLPGSEPETYVVDDGVTVYRFRVGGDRAAEDRARVAEA